jgi:hypothetical protein
MVAQYLESGTMFWVNHLSSNCALVGAVLGDEWASINRYFQTRCYVLFKDGAEGRDGPENHKLSSLKCGRLQQTVERFRRLDGLMGTCLKASPSGVERLLLVGLRRRRPTSLSDTAERCGSELGSSCRPASDHPRCRSGGAAGTASSEGNGFS